ncbi:hypothetical protein SAMN02910358_01523 [Lachnospiraceae bacterium XBB1006]|nr:hypothetical protein SAMN02910358_01523 [Lachnospiraceae bacterium XBB1006]
MRNVLRSSGRAPRARTFRIGEVPALRNEKRLKKGMCCEAAVERQGRGHSEWLQPREATERRNVLRSSGGASKDADIPNW